MGDRIDYKMASKAKHRYQGRMRGEEAGNGSAYDCMRAQNHCVSPVQRRTISLRLASSTDENLRPYAQLPAFASFSLANFLAAKKLLPRF